MMIVTKKLNMENETWRILQTHHLDVSDQSTIHKEAFELYFKIFAHKELMIRQAEGLPPDPVWNAHVNEETKFVKTVRKVPVINVPKHSNAISSHVIYKFKANDDGSLMLKLELHHMDTRAMIKPHSKPTQHNVRQLVSESCVL